jgi:hypothetical protein
LGTAVEKKMSDEAQQFNIINENGSYYLYSIAAAKYVDKNGNFVADKTDAMTIENVGGNYQWKLCIGGHGLNSQIPNQMDCGIVVNGWTTTDAGNSYTILDVTDYVEPVYVSNPADITSTALYTIVPKDRNRGAIFANSESTHLTTTGIANENINDANQQFVFRIKGKEDDSNTKDIDLTVVLTVNSSMLIDQLPVGYYEISEIESDWTWRYNNATAENSSNFYVGVNDAVIEFTAQVKTDQWFNGESFGDYPYQPYNNSSN